MTPSEMNEMLNRYGVHRVTWRDEILREMAQSIGSAYLVGGALGAFATFCLMLAIFNPFGWGW